ncbi:MAG TPA: EamA family transporter, partial [Pinirhizobacter sp.]|uniref:EamA family transporter n=1 Tax=Pinirhizobacter sp. TaxID=2950432 RepID=UPI002BD74547|nr:EamA family transporter [Pinirhizobacter sp.]
MQRIPPHAFFVGSAIFHYLGPSFAVLLFARVPVAGVAWLRIVSAAVVFAVWRRPWRAFLAAASHTRWMIVALGAVFAAMNYCFYRAIAELPLGTVAAIEFAGPVALALAGARSQRNMVALALTVAGVYMLTEVRLAGTPLAFAW